MHLPLDIVIESVVGATAFIGSFVGGYLYSNFKKIPKIINPSGNYKIKKETKKGFKDTGERVYFEDQQQLHQYLEQLNKDRGLNHAAERLNDSNLAK